MYHLLSYPMEDVMPGWPGSPQLRVEKHLQLAGGDVANTVVFSLYNHMGTHYDAPNHYVADGPQIAQLGLERFIFERPLLVEVPKGPEEKITAADLIPHAEQIAGCDLLLFRTGFSRWRTEDAALYERRGPAIGSDCAAWLVEGFPQLRAVAVDFVSMASFGDQEDGNRAHRILFRGPEGRFICGIEDVNMDPVAGKRLKRVFALPIFIKGIDSAPVTMVAETE